MKKALGFLLSVTLLVSCFSTAGMVSHAASAGKKETLPRPSTEITSTSYDDYKKQMEGKKVASAPVATDIAKLALLRSGQVVSGYQGATVAVKILEGGEAAWSFNVPEDGVYSIYVRYYTEKGTGTELLWRLKVDGKMPFTEADGISLNRTWKAKQVEDGRLGVIKSDSRGNELVPEHEEVTTWMETYLIEPSPVTLDPIRIYLTKGSHTVGVMSMRETAVISNITLQNPTPVATYQEVVGDAQQVSGTWSATVEGEGAELKSHSSLVPVYDRTSPYTSPASTSKTKLNYIGGDSWAGAGQWLQWTVKDVPQAGYYRLAVRARQNKQSGSFTTRKVYINGKIQFAEAESWRFPYGSEWKVDVLGSAQSPYLVYLEQGDNTIRMECSPGDLTELLNEAQVTVKALNDAYRQIIMLTGVTPDPYRDYNFDKVLPEVIKTFEVQAKTIEDIGKRLEKIAGARGSFNATLDTLSLQLLDYVEDPRRIAKTLDTYKTNVGGLASWVFSISKQPLDIDYIWVGQAEAELPNQQNGFVKFFRGVGHEFASFFNSFFEDYSLMGEGDGTTNKNIEVWIQSGRDQANVVRSMLINDFTPNHGIGVKLKMISTAVNAQGQLLMATMAGKGPDISVSTPGSDPVNYGVRNAALDISGMEGFAEVVKRFSAESMVPYTFDNKVYALPETYTYPVLFYRKDILSELDIPVPQTWDEVYDAIGNLQRNHMEFVVPANDALGDTNALAMILYQMNGEFYSQDRTRSDLDSKIATDAFTKLTNLYTSYRLPVKYDLANRFRTGEVPLAIQDYSFANQISVFAPEIRGLWDFTIVPGTKDKNGKLQHQVPGGGLATMMLKGVDDKDASWEFMKWWSSAPVQAKYGRDLESIMGVAARYPTANSEAQQQIPWSIEQNKVLGTQQAWSRGIPEVPGGYLTSRHVENAFRKVVNENADPRDTLDEYVTIINDEITYKRQEFGFDKKEGESK